ncbi:MAG TPA: heme ABC transporter ATP-binding protein [Gemmatimonadales bacterium]|nr:heme ABC transporter ATP-binding protein [Gemmatimonadales bacterium]
MVELRGVGHSIGSATLLRDVSVSFRPGGFHVILGPNGAGKTTLLRAATGLLRPSAGEVRYGGRPIAGLSLEELARTRAVLSQHSALAFPLPVEDVVLMGRYPHYGRVPSARDRAIVAQALELVGMAAKRDQSYTTLSGGEQQKVQLARVLAQVWGDDRPGESRYLFLDEPITGLDIHYQIHLLDVVRNLRAAGCTVVAILHDLNLAFEYGDHFLLLSGGRLVCEAARADEIPLPVIEQTFRVRAHRVPDPAGGPVLWRFGMPSPGLDLPPPNL